MNYELGIDIETDYCDSIRLHLNNNEDRDFELEIVKGGTEPLKLQLTCDDVQNIAEAFVKALQAHRTLTGNNL